MPKLKVFRTPIGFHDAYVAAPSQKAALDAWGADANLFARGIAEVITDPDLIKAPMASPGKVIRVLRRADQASEPKAVPPKRSPKKARSAEASPPSQSRMRRAAPAPKADTKPEPKPRPSRVALDKAEAALAAQDSAYAEADRALRDKEQAIKEERRRLRQAHDTKSKNLADRRDRVKAAYRRRIEHWADV